MKVSLLSIVLVLISLSSLPFRTNSVSWSEDGSASVEGSFEIVDNGAKRKLEFHAARGADGSINGETTFRDIVSSTPLSPTSDDVNGDQKKPLFLKAEVDCFVVEANRAALSGSIVEASWPQYVGRKLLVVTQEDREGKGADKRDRLTFGVYKNSQPGWLAQDGERPDEIGNVSWLATDAERPEDEGVSSSKQTNVGCQTFPLSSFSFLNTKQTHGTVSVKP